jgi:hypothetical protein
MLSVGTFFFMEETQLINEGIKKLRRWGVFNP